MGKKSSGRSRGSDMGGLTGFLGGLADLVEKLSDLADKGKELSKTGAISGEGPLKEFKGVYGFNVRVGLGEDRVKVEPFGNIKRDERSGEAVVQEVREPLIDIFEEKGHVLIVAELPGISTEDVKIDVQDDVLTVIAARGEKKYRKEVLLPRSFPSEKITFSCHNGMLEIKCHE